MSSRFELGRETQELDYCTAMDELQFSSEAKRQIAIKLVKDTAKQKNPRKVHRMAAAVFAAVLVAVLGIGAAAATGAFQPVVDLFAPLFGDEESQMELIERMGTPLAISDTVNGITVTAKAMLSDGQNIAVLYSISRDDGSSLVPADAPKDGMLLFGAEGIDNDPWSFQRRSGQMIECLPGAESAEYIQYYSAENGEQDHISVDLGSLEYWYGSPTEVISLSDSGADFWKFDLPVLENNCPIQELSNGHEEFTSNDFPLAVTSVRVSPIAVKVTFELLDENLADKLKANAVDAAELDEASSDELENAIFYDKSLLLRKKDGTEIDLSHFDDGHGNIHPAIIWGYSKETGSVYGICGTSLEEIIPLEEMDRVIFNGIEYPVNP